MKLFIAMVCFCLTLGSATILGADSNHEKIKDAYKQYLRLFNQGDYVGSLVYAEQALTLSKDIIGAENKTTGTLSHNYGINLLRVKRAEQASKVLSDTIVLYKEIYGSQAQELINVYVDLGDARRSADYKSNWYRTYDSALSIAKNAYGRNSAGYGMLLVDLGHIELINQGPRSESRIRKGYKILKSLDNPHPGMFRAEFIMGKLELANHSYKEAREHFERSLIKLNEGEPGSSFELSVRAFLVETLENLGESESATKHLLVIGRNQAEKDVSNIEPLFTKKPRFPSGVIKPQTGTRLDVKKLNEGTVVLEFDVDEKGFTRNIEVILLDGPNDYVKPAIEAVEQFRFAPRFIDGEPVKVKNLNYTFTFLL